MYDAVHKRRNDDNIIVAWQTTQLLNMFAEKPISVFDLAPFLFEDKDLPSKQEEQDAGKDDIISGESRYDKVRRALMKEEEERFEKHLIGKYIPTFAEQDGD